MSKHISQEAVKFLNNIRVTTKKKKQTITATHAVDLLLEKMPDLSRAEVYNSAEEAGLNKLTARNVYDKRARESTVTKSKSKSKSSGKGKPAKSRRSVH
jgi:hypothetical protein